MTWVAEVVAAAVRILLPPAQAVEISTVVRKYKQTYLEGLLCWPPVAPSCDTSQSVSWPSGWTFLPIGRAPPAALVGRAEYMSVSVGLVRRCQSQHRGRWQYPTGYGLLGGYLPYVVSKWEWFHIL